MAYETYWEEGGIRWVYTGIMTNDDILRANLELYKDPRFESIQYEIADLRGVSEFAASAEAVRKLSHMDRSQSARNPDMKVAILATAPLMRGIARMYALSAGETPWETRIFKSEEDARTWLAA